MIVAARELEEHVDRTITYGPGDVFTGVLVWAEIKPKLPHPEDLPERVFITTSDGRSATLRPDEEVTVHVADDTR